MRPSVKVQAIFILLLLGGHEAVRINDNANLTSLSLANVEDEMGETKPTEYEKQWKEENKDCEWESRTGYCFGKGCVYKYMTLDTGNTVCKKSDDYLLKSDPSKYIKMYSEILKSKSEKYNQKCQSRFSSLNLWCKRRLQHMFNALRFLALAQERSENEAAANQQEIAEAFKSSLSNIAGTWGEDGELLMKLKAKMESSDAMLRNPEDTLKRMMDLSQKITAGTKDEHDEAKKIIEGPDDLEPMSEDVIQRSDDFEPIEDASEDTEPDEEEEAEVKEAQETLDSQLVELDPFSDGTDGGSSALQLPSDETVMKLQAAVTTAAFMGVAILIVATTVGFPPVTVGALIGWALVSIFSCGLWHGGVYHGSNHKGQEDSSNTSEVVEPQGMSKKTAVWKTVKCAGKVLLFPVILLYKGLKWTNLKLYRYFKKRREQKKQQKQKEEQQKESGTE